MSNTTQLKYARPLESYAFAGSLATSYEWDVPTPPSIVLLFGLSAVGPIASGPFSRCRTGGNRSPHFRPLVFEKSIPHWLKPTRLSFCPATRSLVSTGL